jgi:hypothetical protein
MNSLSTSVWLCALFVGSIASALLSSCAHADDDWSLLLAPYVWFAGAKGDLSVVPDAPATAIDVSASDALNGTEASFMLMLEAKRRRHGIFLDLFYSDVLQENEPLSASSLNWEASVEETLVTAGYTYEMYRSSQVVVDAIGGVRYWEVENTLEFVGGLGALEGFSVRDSESWMDPLVGVKVKVRLPESRVYLAGFLGGGGASAGSDSFYDVSANVGYQFTDSIFASIGYRLFDVDYQSSSFTYKVKQQGWLVGLVWFFGANALASQE